jgi:hypothetical protein
MESNRRQTTTGINAENPRRAIVQAKIKASVYVIVEQPAQGQLGSKEEREEPGEVA